MPGEARRGKTRRRPDKKVSPGFENNNYFAIAFEKVRQYPGIYIHVSAV